VSAPERSPPRAHHLQFKYALVERALTDAPGFVELSGSADTLAALWKEVGAQTAEAESDVRVRRSLEALDEPM